MLFFLLYTQQHYQYCNIASSHNTEMINGSSRNIWGLYDFTIEFSITSRATICHFQDVPRSEVETSLT